MIEFKRRKEVDSWVRGGIKKKVYLIYVISSLLI